MNWNRDLTSRGALLFKGWLFLILGTVASVLLLADAFSLQRLVLWAIAIWSFCRFYYFLFHVLEHYAGRDRPYAGLLDAMKWALCRKSRDSGD